MAEKTVEPVRQIENRILNLRGQRVMLDADLADLYGVPTKALNQKIGVKSSFLIFFCKSCYCRYFRKTRGSGLRI